MTALQYPSSQYSTAARLKGRDEHANLLRQEHSQAFY